MNRAVFLDRDGVINQKAPEGEYVTRLSELIFLPQVGDAVRLLRSAGFLVIIVTNQRGVSRGKIRLAELQAMHDAIAGFFSAEHAPLDDIYVCPHEGGCECRKPAPGMLLRAAREHGIDLQNSWLVGDSLSDIEAGKRAGCYTVLISGTVPDWPKDLQPDLRADSLRHAATLILEADRTTTKPQPADHG